MLPFCVTSSEFVCTIRKAYQSAFWISRVGMSYLNYLALQRCGNSYMESGINQSRKGDRSKVLNEHRRQNDL